MYDILRDSTFGYLVRYATRNKFLLHLDEKPGFELPSPTPQDDEKRAGSDSEGTDDDQNEIDIESGPVSNGNAQVLQSDDHDGHSLAATASRPIHPVLTSDGIVLIDWYSTDDPDNPQNFSTGKKIYISVLLSVYTFAVYIGSSIYTSGMGQIEDRFGVSATASALGISLYVLAYGIGPMLFSPLSEIPAIGKNPPYVATFAIFVLLTIPSALTDSFAGLMVLRFLLGFFGSPCLATCGASFQDMFPLIKIPYLMVLWASTATLGPAFGPVIAGYTVEAESWRWTQWEMLWISGPIFIVMFLTLPETSAATILYQRASRVRNVLDRTDLKSQSEIDQAHMNVGQVAFDALVKPWEINALDPAVLFSTVYTSLLYSIFYSFFESTPQVFPKIYHFSLGASGLPYLSAAVAILICAPLYSGYWYFFVDRPFAVKGIGPPEERLQVGLVGSVIIPIGLFLYAWTSRESIHWIVPTIGLGMSVGGTFLIIQSIFLYLPFTYPKYAASLFAANDFARSLMAAGAILFSRPMFINLGIGPGVSLLGGLTIVCAVLLFMLYKYGAVLRARSKFAG